MPGSWIEDQDLDNSYEYWENGRPTRVPNTAVRVARNGRY